MRTGTSVAETIPIARPPIAIQAVVRHLFKLGVLALALFARAELPYRVIGLVNRRVGFLRSVFFCYAADSRYARHYCYEWSERWLKWFPAPIALFRQGGKWGLAMASPVTEAEFLDWSNSASFRQLLNRINRIAGLLGAAEVNRGGILTGMRYRRFGTKTSRLPRIVAVVYDAIMRTRERQFGGESVPIVLLGGRGLVGAALHARLTQEGWDVRIVDTADGSATLPVDLKGQRCMLVDVARKGALATYLDELWPGLVILNETYPQPSESMLRSLGQRQIPVYHIVGSPAFIWPMLPHAYHAGLPCCALHDTEAAAAMVRRLV